MLYYSSVGIFEIVHYNGKIELYDYNTTRLIGTFDNYNQVLAMISSLENQAENQE